jgi:hypothetical protein
MKAAHFFIFPMMILLTAMAISSCKQTGKKGDKVTLATVTDNDSLKNESALQKDSANPVRDDSAANKKVSGSRKPGDLDFLVEFEGKYPHDVNFLDNPVIQQRLRTMLGDRFLFLKEKWAVETPIKIKNNILVASACEAHNCDNTNFMIAIDIANNLMYAGIREGQNAKLYYEMQNEPPQPLLDWVMRRNSQ